MQMVNWQCVVMFLFWFVVGHSQAQRSCETGNGMHRHPSTSCLRVYNGPWYPLLHKVSAPD